MVLTVQTDCITTHLSAILNLRKESTRNALSVLFFHDVAGFQVVLSDVSDAVAAAMQDNIQYM